MGLHPDSTGNVLAPKLELEASDFSSSDSLLESGESSHHLPSISKYYQNLTSSQPFLVGWISATVICLLVMFILVAFFMPMVLYPTDQVCSAKLSMYSPMLEAVEYEQVTLANDFDEPSIYRGYPTREREQAWEALWNHKTMNIPNSKVPLLSYTPTADYMHTPAKYGGGLEALVEVFHQLHCLGLIRQYIYLDSYEVRPRAFNVNDTVIHTHVDHCIETVRMALMCAGDVTPMLIRDDPQGHLGAKAEFSTTRKCRKWDSLVDWISVNGVDP